MFKKIIKEKDKKLFKKSVQDAKGTLKKGNMIMLAVGLLLGTVFNAVVSSLANDVIMGAITHQMNLNTLEDLKSHGVLYGKFLGRIIQFAAVTFSMFVLLIGFFMFVNWKKRRMKPEPPKPVEPTTEELILAELKLINSSLKHQQVEEQLLDVYSKT